MKSALGSIWSNRIARLLIGVVLALNLQCAFLFLATPTIFAPGFELNGIPGDLMVRGMGILFLMWSIPSLFAISNPLKRKISLIEAVLMQAVGLLGESLLVYLLPAGHDILQATGMRFIVFDGGGLILLLAAFYLVF